MKNMQENLLRKYARHAEFIGEELLHIQQPGCFGSQLIHLASFSNQCGDVNDLLTLGADIDVQGDLGLSALHYAVLGEAVEAIQLLLEKGASKEIENEFRETPEQMARVLGYQQIEKLLRASELSTSYSFDGASTAKDRWLEFKSIQHGNFWVND